MEAFSILLGVIVMLVIVVYVSSQIKKNNMSNEDNEESKDVSFSEEEAVAEERLNLEAKQISEEKPGTEVVMEKNEYIKDEKECGKHKYEKVLSTEEKREWIENFVNIKRFVSAGWTCLGLLVGFLFGRLLGYGMDFTMIVFVLLGGFIGGVLGTNSVGAAMMKAIVAEQSIVNEELMTKILSKLEETDNKNR